MPHTILFFGNLYLRRFDFFLSDICGQAKKGKNLLNSSLNTKKNYVHKKFYKSNPTILLPKAATSKMLRDLKRDFRFSKIVELPHAKKYKSKKSEN